MRRQALVPIAPLEHIHHLLGRQPVRTALLEKLVLRDPRLVRHAQQERLLLLQERGRVQIATLVRSHQLLAKSPWKVEAKFQVLLQVAHCVPPLRAVVAPTLVNRIVQKAALTAY